MAEAIAEGARWTERAQTAGAVLIAEGLTAHNAPDEEAPATCRALGQTAARR